MKPGRAFPFAIDHRLRPWSRLFGIHPETCTVLVTPGQVSVAFGRWSLTTSPANVVDATVTGPYQWWKVAGPAHLSLSDLGITFATTAERGVCLSFAEAVRGFDPLGLLRHRGATITVAEPASFCAAVLEAASAARSGSVGPDADVGVRQGTYRASAAAVVRWVRRDESVRHEQRSVTAITPPDQEIADDQLVQRFDDGVGPAFHRRYEIVIDGAPVDARAATARFGADLNAASNPRLAPFNKLCGELGRIAAGDRYVVALAGPWSAPVLVVGVWETGFRLATLEGHLEAGLIEFRFEDVDDGSLRFVIESWARSGDHALRVLYDCFGLARALQSEMWVELCEVMPGLVEGRQRGPVDMLTERTAGSCRGLSR